MSLSITSNPSMYPAYQPYAIQPAMSQVSVAAYQTDSLQLKPQTTPVIGDTPPTESPGRIWDRADVRVGLLMAGTATAGGTIGYFASRAAGTSLAVGTAVGATIGAALPIAMVIWALNRWGK